MSRKRRQYSADFKAKVALAALKGDETTSEIAARFEIHLTMVSQWKRELMDNATGVIKRFATGSDCTCCSILPVIASMRSSR